MKALFLVHRSAQFGILFFQTKLGFVASLELAGELFLELGHKLPQFVVLRSQPVESSASPVVASRIDQAPCRLDSSSARSSCKISSMRYKQIQVAMQAAGKGLDAICLYFCCHARHLPFNNSKASCRKAWQSIPPPPQFSCGCAKWLGIKGANHRLNNRSRIARHEAWSEFPAKANTEPIGTRPRARPRGPPEFTRIFAKPGCLRQPHDGI